MVLNTVVLNTAVLNAVALNAAIQNSAMPNAVRWIGWRGTRSYSREPFPRAISESHPRPLSPGTPMTARVERTGIMKPVEGHDFNRAGWYWRGVQVAAVGRQAETDPVGWLCQPVLPAG